MRCAWLAKPIINVADLPVMPSLNGYFCTIDGRLDGYDFVIEVGHVARDNPPAERYEVRLRWGLGLEKDEPWGSSAVRYLPSIWAACEMAAGLARRFRRDGFSAIVVGFIPGSVRDSYDTTDLGM